MSKIVVPVRRVERNASSSAKATVEIRSQSAGELRVAGRHLVPADGEQRGQRRVLVAEQPHGPHRPPQQAAQHVAARLVAGRHAVADQHHRAPHVVGHDPEPHVVLRVRAVAPTGELLGLLDDREHHVDLVHVRLVLHQDRDALETHPGVDVLLRQATCDVEVGLAAYGAQLVLHEHEVPDLEVAVLRAEVAGRTVVRSPVVEDLRARTTRPGHTHRPVVLALAEADDPLVGEPGHLLPQLGSLRVVLVDARVEPALLEAPATVGDRLGDQVPRELDRTLLEVVAEAEVAAHLEEGAVAGGLPDVLDVRGAHALLHADRAVVRRRLLAEEVGLERHHAGVHEQQVGVRHEQRGRGHHLVTRRFEVRDEAAADVSGLHSSGTPGSAGASGRTRWRR